MRRLQNGTDSVARYGAAVMKVLFYDGLERLLPNARDSDDWFAASVAVDDVGRRIRQLASGAVLQNGLNDGVAAADLPDAVCASAHDIHGEVVRRRQQLVLREELHGVEKYTSDLWILEWLERLAPIALNARSQLVDGAHAVLRTEQAPRLAHVHAGEAREESYTDDAVA